ncbi:response regulator transcription factor [uncultured Bacteroides sp.]|uniref:response regulator transcription factor n=1 Tax=uncultured Bacteroides sp. TaxID=162156 RepID=UPI0025FB6650|nr:response regulator transcription factor [uncultured Bacteroides sp.]
MDKIKVLFVDDDLLFSNIIMNALQGNGYEVNCQHSTIGISELVRQFNPDIILLDLKIGNENGISAVPKIQLVAPNIPIIFMSSHKESHEVQRALKQGAITYLMKPFDMEILFAHIDRHARPCTNISISIGRLKLNLLTQTLYKGKNEIKTLSRLEFEILILLYEHKNQYVMLDDLRELWKDKTMNEHTLYNYISKLRRMLSADKRIKIENHGNGYMLQISR